MLALFLVVFIQAGLAEGAATATRTPISKTVTNPCTAEGVDLNGESTIVTSVTEDGKGGVHFVFHESSQTTGTGQFTGLRFEGAENDGTEVQDPSGPPVETTMRTETRLMAPGRGNNFVMFILFHITVNGQGETTAEVTQITAECL